jgi:hypothetical protein
MRQAMGTRASIHAAVLGLSCLVATACTPEGDPKIALAQPPGPGTCAEWTGQPVDRSCIPRMAMAGVPLVLEIEERCGACGTTAEKCSVSVEAHTVTLSLDGKTCEPPAGVACSEACGKNRVRCKLPALLEGRYEIRYGDTSRNVDHLDVVRDHDATRACTLDDPNTVSNGG